MQDRPDAAELLEAVEDFLRGQSAAASERWLRFQLLVAANTLGIVRREMLHEDHYTHEEWQRLDGLLGAQEPPAAHGAFAAALRTRDAELCARIARGDFDAPEAEARLFEHFWQTIEDKVRIANPAELTR
ncbi:MAG: hypothetical protein HYX53_12655 [Chloroflexi bacterium]|nr:hypothetical protein [Chloroflexota bacterium]